MGRSRYRFVDATQPHFMTLTVLHWIPVFTRPETTNILLESLSYLSRERLKLHGYVILENHMRLVAQSPNLGHDIARLKAHTSRELIAWLTSRKVRVILDQLAFYRKAHKAHRAYQFWQEGVHPELIKDRDMMRQKLEYTHRNPVERGYVDEPEHWRRSSARNYAGQEGEIRICMDW